MTAVHSLLRTSVLDAMRELLNERAWSKITLTDLAKRAGLSRQTLYNEFGSRSGLLRAYALRLTDVFVDQMHNAVERNVGDGQAGIREGVADFLVAVAGDPLVRSLHSGDAPADLLRLVTLDSAPLLNRAAVRLTDTFGASWIGATPPDAAVLARAFARLGMSYVAMPPDHDVAGDLAALLGPYVAAAAR